MEKIELLKAENNSYRTKFISLIKSKSEISTVELSRLYDDLLNSSPIIIELDISNVEILNNLILEIMKLDISIGYCSFHEENNNQS